MTRRWRFAEKFALTGSGTARYCLVLVSFATMEVTVPSTAGIVSDVTTEFTSSPRSPNTKLSVTMLFMHGPEVYVSVYVLVPVPSELTLYVHENVPVQVASGAPPKVGA